MKPLNLFFALCLLCHGADAQTPANINYGMISGSLGTLFPMHPGKVFSTSFNYQSVSASTGAATTHGFSGSTATFRSTAILADIIHGAYVTDNNYFDFGIGINGDMNDDQQGYLKFGYGRIFHAGCWQIQPTLDLYVAFDGPDKLGTIDNKDSTIYVLGFTAKPQFTVTSSDANGNPETDTYNAGTLEVAYKRNSFLAAPKVLFGTLISRRVYVGIEAGWLLQLGQSSTIKLVQYDENDDGNSNPVGKVHLGQNGSLTGPEVALNVAYCFGGIFSRKKNGGKKP